MDKRVPFFHKVHLMALYDKSSKICLAISTTVFMLLASVEITQSIYLMLRPYQKAGMDKLAQDLIEHGLRKGIAVRMVDNMFGYSESNPAEKECMANALLAYALLQP